MHKLQIFLLQFLHLVTKLRSSWPIFSWSAPISSPGASFPLPHYTAPSPALVPLLEVCVLGTKSGTQASF